MFKNEKFRKKYEDVCEDHPSEDTTQKESSASSEEVSVDITDKIKILEQKLAELKAKAAQKLEETKKLEAAQRRDEAKIVNMAIDKYEEAKQLCNQKIKSAYEDYCEKVAAAERDLALVEKEADAKLNEFLKTHDSFHYSYKSPDGAVSRDYSYRNSQYNVFDNFNIFSKAVRDLWNWKF